jgi:hypothetical protein
MSETPMSRTTLVHGLAGFLVLGTVAVTIARCDGIGMPACLTWSHGLSLLGLPPAERRLAEFLILLPPAALIVCLVRQVVGWSTFGTFSPALLGLAFRHPETWQGFPVFLGLLLGGWAMRQVLQPLRLLHVPRLSVLLTMLALALLLVVAQAPKLGWHLSDDLILFPLVILTGIIERMWLIGSEDGQRASFQILLTTLLTAVLISGLLGRPAVVDFLLHHPEMLLLVMAGQLVLGRFTGMRWTEIARFRWLVSDAATSDVAMNANSQTQDNLLLLRFEAGSSRYRLSQETDAWPSASGSLGSVV